MMLNKWPIEDEHDIANLEDALDGLSEPEAACLRIIVAELSRQEVWDPKLGAVHYFLDVHITSPRRRFTGLPTIAALSVDKPYRDLPTLRMDKSEAL